MKVLLYWLVLALLTGATFARPSSAPTIAAKYGAPAAYTDGTLQYDDFTVRLVTKTDHVRSSGRTPWTVYQFEVLDHDRRTIGGDVRFNSEERANGRRFDVRGKIYVAEMYSSTADVPSQSQGSATSPTRLAPGTIVIWNEATAARQNTALRKIWATEKVDPAARYFPQNAYANGILITGFPPLVGRNDDGLRSLAPQTLEAVTVSVARGEDLDSSVPLVECRYGARAFYRGDVLRYPDFKIRWLARTETNPTDINAAFVRHEFYVYDVAGKRSDFGNLNFDTSGLANGCSFEVGGATYFAELFFTTAAIADRANARLPLREGEFIVWNEESARSGNPTILSAWSEPSKRSRVFAAGVPLTGMFTGTYMWDANEAVKLGDLDTPVRAIRTTKLVYPAAFAGTGFIGHVGGMIFVNPDGRVDRAVTNHGNELAFKNPTQKALIGWQFTPPMKDGQPVKAWLSFDWDVSEPTPDIPVIRFR